MRETRIRSLTRKSLASPVDAGGPDRVRTDDLLDANQALSQLSYGPMIGTLPLKERFMGVFENRMDSPRPKS